MGWEGGQEGGQQCQGAVVRSWRVVLETGLFWFEIRPAAHFHIAFFETHQQHVFQYLVYCSLCCVSRLQ